ncbi:MAG: carbamate kinase [Egibacteraceae bacterium]
MKGVQTSPRTGHTCVLAFGGNALTSQEDDGTYADQQANAIGMARVVADLVAGGYQVAVTHGNGPQVGCLAVQQEEGASLVPPQPLFALGAMTQGQIGHLLTIALRRAGIDAVAVVTHVLVEGDQPASARSSKPIGPFFDKEEAGRLADARGWEVREDSGRGYRRVVPSPAPLRILEGPVICELVEAGHVVIAAGGGGIPVKRQDNGDLVGVEAVVDKDLAAERLAALLGAQALALVTQVPEVALDFGTPRQRGVHQMTVDEAEAHLDAGQFPPGSMGPKVEAAIAFIRNGGELAVITSPPNVISALRGKHGTRIVKEGSA